MVTYCAWCVDVYSTTIDTAICALSLCNIRYGVYIFFRNTHKTVDANSRFNWRRHHRVIVIEYTDKSRIKSWERVHTKCSKTKKHHTHVRVSAFTLIRWFLCVFFLFSPKNSEQFFVSFLPHIPFHVVTHIHLVCCHFVYMALRYLNLSHSQQVTSYICLRRYLIYNNSTRKSLCAVCIENTVQRVSEKEENTIYFVFTNKCFKSNAETAVVLAATVYFE